MAKPFALFGVIGTVVLASVSLAADGEDPSKYVLPPSAASLSGIQEQTIANIFTSCTSGINQGLNQAALSLQSAVGGGKSPGSGMVSMNSDCTVVPGMGGNGITIGGSAIDPASITCTSIMQGSSFNKEYFDQLWSTLKTADQVNKCKTAKATAAKGELQCLTNAAQILDSQMSQLQESYTQAMQRNSTAVSQLTSMEADRKGQQDEVKKRLMGDPNGKPGLRQLLDKSQGMLAAMDAEVTQLDSMVKDSKTARGKLAELYSQKVGAEAQNCFSQKQDSRYLCDTLRPGENRPEQAFNSGCAKGTACDWLMCRYWENQHLVGGKLDRSQKAKEDAKNSAKILNGIFSSIMNEMPKANKNAADYLMTMRDNFSTIKTSADVEKAFGSQLSGLDGRGFDIRGNTVNILKSCFSDANRRVAREKDNPGTALYEARIGADKGDQVLQGTVNNLLTRYQSQWQDNMSGLTGLNLPLDVGRCRSSTPDVQLGCVKQFRGNMEALISGTPANGIPVGGIQMQIRGTKAENTISFTCQGLKGCVTALENTDRNLSEEVKRVGDFKRNYILQANNSVDAFTKRVAAMLGPQMRDLDARLKAINTSLGSLGARGIDIQLKTGRNFTKDEDGLYQMSGGGRGGSGTTTIQDAIAASQPYLDVKGNNFADSISSLGEATNKFQEENTKIAMSIGKLQGLETTCRKEIAGQLGATMATSADAVAACASEFEFCQEQSGVRDGGSIWDLANTISDAPGFESFTYKANLEGSLQQGRQDCERKVQRMKSLTPEELRKQLDTQAPNRSCGTLVRNLKRGVAQYSRALSGDNRADKAERADGY
mgnify:CR=1 FL=1